MGLGSACVEDSVQIQSVTLLLCSLLKEPAPICFGSGNLLRPHAFADINPSRIRTLDLEDECSNHYTREAPRPLNTADPDLDLRTPGLCISLDRRKLRLLKMMMWTLTLTSRKRFISYDMWNQNIIVCCDLILLLLVFLSSRDSTALVCRRICFTMTPNLVSWPPYTPVLLSVTVHFVVGPSKGISGLTFCHLCSIICN